MTIDTIAFWKWAYSDFLSNTNRSVLWEFIIHEALGITSDKKIEWDNVDLRYKWIKIEVKTSAYIQSWEQKWISKIQFDIAPRTKSWDSMTNTFSDSSGRAADIYIFCLLEILDKEIASPENILDMKNWWFYVVSTKNLDNFFPLQKSISLSKLSTITERIDFHLLKSTIENISL
jgi:hypothetical protein